MKQVVFVIAACVAMPAIAQGAVAPATISKVETLDNGSVIAMVKAGLGPESVIAKINASRGQFETSTQSLIELKQAGVPDAVIAAMLNRSGARTAPSTVADNGSPDPLVPHSPGIYILDPVGTGRMIRIDATVSNQMKTTGTLGFAFSYGLASMKMKSVIPNSTARVQAPGRQPSFYFFFNAGSPMAALSEFGTSFSIASTTPNEFSLVRFDQKQDHREAALGSFNIGGAKMGVSDKARVAFTYSDIAPGVFKVTPSAPLDPGQYGFVYSTGAAAMGYGARIFDFSVN